MTPIDRRTWKIDAAFIAGLAAAAAGLFVVSGQPVAQSRAQAASLTTQVAQATAEQATLGDRRRALTARIDRLQSAIANSSVPLRSADRINDQVADLTNAAEECGLRLSEVKPGLASDVVDHTERPISVSGSGTFEGLVAMLDKLRVRFPDVRVRSMLVSRDAGQRRGASADQGPQSTTFQLEMVWFADPAGS